MDAIEICKVINSPKQRRVRCNSVVTPSVVEAMVAEYESGVSARVLVDHFRMTYARIKQVLELSGVHIRSRTEGLIMSNETTGFCARAGLTRRMLDAGQLMEVAALRDAGVGWREIEARFGLGEDNARRLLKAEGLWREPAHRSYTLNEEYFDTIDTPEKAYFFGLLMADGCVSRTRQGKIGVVSINLNVDDVHILEEFRAAIGFSKSLRDMFLNKPEKSNTLPQKYLGIHSFRMAEALNRHGCTPRKSLTVRYPDFLPDGLHRHFIRGYFDGDGCVSSFVRPNGRMDIFFNFVGSLFMMEGIQSHLVRCCGFAPVKIQPRIGCYLLAHGGNGKAETMFKFLYGDGGPRLHRKHQKWCDSLTVVRDNQARFRAGLAPSVPADEAAELYIAGESTPCLARRYGVNVSKVRDELIKKGVRFRDFGRPRTSPRHK